MQLLSATFLVGLVCSNGALAAPAASNPKLAKRSVVINRVAAGWVERDVLHMKIKALEKFKVPMSDELKAAYVVNRAQAKTRAQKRARAKHSGHRGNRDDNGGGGVATVTVTVTAGDVAAATTASAAAAATSSVSGSSGNATGSIGGASGNGSTTQATGQVGDVENVPQPGDLEFLSEVVIGGQKIVMDFDTGSSDLWVFSTNLDAQTQQGHTVFDPAKSTTFQPDTTGQHTSFQITFGDGSSASGNSKNTIGTDVVNIGGAVAQAQTVELADKVTGNLLSDTASNGLVGFAFSSINAVQPKSVKTYFDTIADDLAQPIFAADLRPGQPGSYRLGEVDESAFTGQLTEIPIDNSQGFWQFQSSTFSVGNNGQAQTNSQNSPAIADTGTTLLLADQDVVDGYYSQVKGAQFNQQAQLVTFPCSFDLPDLNLAVGTNYNAVIPGKLLNFQAIDQTNSTCAGALQSNQGAGIQIFGDIFFKAQYTVFNVRKNTISCAPHAGV